MIPETMTVPSVRVPFMAGGLRGLRRGIGRFCAAAVLMHSRHGSSSGRRKKAGKAGNLELAVEKEIASNRNAVPFFYSREDGEVISGFLSGFDGSGSEFAARALDIHHFSQAAIKNGRRGDRENFPIFIGDGDGLTGKLF